MQQSARCLVCFGLLVTLLGNLADTKAIAAVEADVPGYVVGSVAIGSPLQGDVVYGGSSLFVGVGHYGAGGQSILRIDHDGTQTAVVVGLNSIGGILFDAPTETLFFTDNGGEIFGATTGDTVYKLAEALNSVGAEAVDLEILPAQTVANAARLELATPSTLLVTDAAGGGNGGVIAVNLTADPPTASSLLTGLDYAAGISVLGDTSLLVGNVDAGSYAGSVEHYSAGGVHLETFALPGGAFDQVLDASGNLLVTGAFAGDGSSSVLLSIDPTATISQIASGWQFSAGIGIDLPSGQLAVIDSCFPACTELTQLTPVEQLTGLGKGTRDCNVAFYGGQERRTRKGKGRGRWECTDGESACDRDGTVNGSCSFVVGVCLGLEDPNEAKCIAAVLDEVEVRRSPKIAAGRAFPVLQDIVDAVVPAPHPICSERTTIEVPAKKRVTLKLTARSEGRSLDRDRLKLLCHRADT